MNLIQKNAIQLKRLDRLPDSLMQKLAAYKFICIGEIHGTLEGPAITYGLVKLLCRSKRVVLAIEIPQKEQTTIDAFFQSGDVEVLRNSAFFTQGSQYGVSSKAMVDLLIKLRALPNVSIYCFDPQDVQASKEVNIHSSQDRDLKMAENLISKFKQDNNQTFIVLAGSLHTQLSKGIPGMDPDFKPMSYFLYHLLDSQIAYKDILAIMLRFQQGSAWACIADENLNVKTGVYKFPKQQDVYSEAVKWNKYFLFEESLVNGHNATFFTRKITSSEPFIQHNN